MKRINLPAIKETTKAYQSKPKVNNSNNSYLNLVEFKQLKQHSPVQFQQSILSLQSTIAPSVIM